MDEKKPERTKILIRLNEGSDPAVYWHPRIQDLDLWPSHDKWEIWAE